jgi:MFS family permease
MSVIVSRNETRASAVGFAATVGNTVGITPAVSATFGVFLIPIATDFQWSRAGVSGVLGLISLVSAIVYPIVGRLMDHFGPSRIIVLGNLLLGLSIMALSLSTGSPLQFYILFALVGIAGSIPSTAMLSKVVSNWFDARRGLMLGVTAGVGNGIGATVMPILAGILLGSLGWRGSFVAIGALVIAVGFPTMALLLRDAPQKAREDGTILDGVSLSEAIRTRAFWLLLGAVAIGAGGMTAVFTHVVPMLIDRGTDLTGATMVMAVFALVTAAWQIVTGHMLDRWRSPRVVVPMFAAAIIGLLLLQFGHGMPLMLLAGVLLGLGMGAEYGALPYFISRYFGLRCYGSIAGALYSVVLLAQGITPALMDIGFDRSGSYDAAALTISIALAVGIGLLSILPSFTALPTVEDIEPNGLAVPA